MPSVIGLRSWCTWHGSNGTCIVHRPCFCGAVPVLHAGNDSLCSKHAVWNASEQRWKRPTDERN